MKLRIAEQDVVGEYPLQQMTDRELIGHADAAMCLHGGLRDGTTEPSGLRLEDRDVGRSCPIGFT